VTQSNPPTVEVGSDRVAVITLRRPDVLNALDSACHIAIGDALTAL
jgi:enoyl-CoA hydratase/carnithine racemase